MVCPSCRTANRPGALRCEVCGTSLSRAAAAPPRRGLAIASLVLGILALPTFGLLLIGAVVGLILGIVALTRANRAPQEFGGRGLAIGGIVCSGLSLIAVVPLMIIMAIAIPSLLRARISANESAATGDIRAIMSAEAVYMAAAGQYGSLECLGQPAPCSPAVGTIPLIDAELQSSEPRHGYTRTLHLGPPVGLPSGGAGPATFAYVAVPVVFGRTGNRSFCGDSNGIVCSQADGSTPNLADGTCDTTACQPLGHGGFD